MRPLLKFKQAVMAVVCGVAALQAGAQGYPSKSINLIVPYPAGGPSDFVARQLQPNLTKSLGQVVVVDNVGGVAGALGVQKMLSATPDGHTITLGSPLELIIAPMSIASVKYTPADVKLVAQIVKAPLVMLARKDLPANTVDELLALANKPGAKELAIANGGTGGMFHLVAEKFAQQAGGQYIHVPYKGSTPMMTDLMGGQVDLAFTVFGGSVPAMVAEGKVKALGLANKAPLPKFPQIAALASHPKLSGFEFDSWAGILVPKNTSDEVSQRLNKAVYDALQNVEVRKSFEASGNLVVAPTPLAELDRIYKGEVARYQAIAKSINLQPQ